MALEEVVAAVIVVVEEEEDMEEAGAAAVPAATTTKSVLRRRTSLILRSIWTSGSTSSLTADDKVGFLLFHQTTASKLFSRCAAGILGGFS